MLEEILPTMDPTDPMNFNWTEVEIGQAFEDVNSNLYWFTGETKNYMYAVMENEVGKNEIVHKLSLIRAPEYDFEFRRMA